MTAIRQFEFKIGGTGEIPISFTDALLGDPINADALPTVLNMWVNNAPVSPLLALYGNVISQRLDLGSAPVVGSYALRFDTNAFTDVDIVTYQLRAVVGGAVLRQTYTAVFNEAEAINADDIAAGVWDAATTDYTLAGSFGEMVGNKLLRFKRWFASQS